MRRYDNLLSDDFIEFLSYRVWCILTVATETNKIALKYAFSLWQIVEALMEDCCNLSAVVLVNVLVRFVDLDSHFVEDRFGPHEELSRGRIDAPNYSGCSVHLYT